MGPFAQSFGGMALVGIQAGLVFAWLSPSTDSFALRIGTLVLSIVVASVATAIEVWLIGRLHRR
jgi:hypothetical protein